MMRAAGFILERHPVKGGAYYRDEGLRIQWKVSRKHRKKRLFLRLAASGEFEDFFVMCGITLEVLNLALAVFSHTQMTQHPLEFI